MVEKYRQMLFGLKSEKLLLKLEQLEFELEEDEATQAEAEAIAERVSPIKEPKSLLERKPLPRPESFQQNGLLIEREELNSNLRFILGWEASALCNDCRGA